MSDLIPARMFDGQLWVQAGEAERLRHDLARSMEAHTAALNELAEARNEAEYLRHYKEVSDVEGRLAEAEIESVQSELDNTRDELTSVCGRLIKAERELAEARGLLREVPVRCACECLAELRASIDAFLAADQPKLGISGLDAPDTRQP
jgi:hypothetical protein